MAQQGPELPGTQIVSAEELRRAGVMRLADIVLLADRWDVATVDGYTWYPTPPGGSPQTTRWLLLVDGQRIDLDLYGTTDLNQIGLPLQAISHVEFVSTPRLAGGTLASHGLIQLHTIEPRRGLTVGGWLTTGSEIGDPGPFGFTPRGGDNVDRMGHDGSAMLGYGGRGWSALAALHQSQAAPTDPTLVNRYSEAVGDAPRIRVLAPTLKLEGSAAGGRHALAVLHSRTDGFLLLPPLAGVTATRQHFTRLSAAGSFGTRGGARVRYELAGSETRARSRGASRDVPLDWRARVSSFRVEREGRPGSWLRLAGAGFRLTRVDTPTGFRRSRIGVGTLYLELAPGRRGMLPVLRGAFTAASGEIGVAGVLSGSRRVGREAWVTARLGYARDIRAEDNSIWAWTDRGYSLLRDAGAELSVSGALRPAHQVSADLEWSQRLRSATTVSLRGFFRSSWRAAMARQTLHYVESNRSVAGAMILDTDANGELAGAELAAGGRLASWLRARLVYRQQALVSGDEAFRDAWAAVPRRFARATAELLPAPGLEFRVDAVYRSRSQWPDYRLAEIESGGFFRASIPGFVSLDVAAQKWLWHRRLRAHIGIRNLLGATVRYHPAGAEFAPTALVQLEALLP